MIGVEFKGRLGNQLFQYVFLRYLREKHPNKIIFPPNPHHAYLTKYFQLEAVDSLLLGSKLYSAVTRVIPRVLPFKPVYVHNFVTPKHIMARSFQMYYGYYQTDWYYSQMSKKPKIELQPDVVRRFQRDFGSVLDNNKTIVVHIRRTDYLSYGKRDISLPIEHFQRQLGLIENLDLYKVYFVSDDIEFVKKHFDERPNFNFSINDEITDFQLIQNADIAIISNSSFAWWACFLSVKNQRVIAPLNWMGFRIGAEHPKGVMTKKFEWVSAI